MKRMKYQIRYDMMAGICDNWKLYLVYVVMFLVIGFTVYDSSSCGRTGVPFSWFDCVAGYFLGVEDFSGAERTQTFRIPFEWFCIHLGLLFSVARFPVADYKERGYQYLIRTGSKSVWWLGKCIWSMMHTIIYHILLYGVAFGISVMVKGGILWENTDIWGMHLGKRSVLYIVLYFCIVPIMISMVLVSIELFAAFVWNPVTAYAIVIVILVASAYWKNPYFPGNYTMFCRYTTELNGVGLIKLCIGCFIMAGIFFITGYEVFRKKEWLGMED